MYTVYALICLRNNATEIIPQLERTRNQQEIQNHDHGADPMVYESSLHHGHELVDIKASHMYIYIYYRYIMYNIYICMYNISYIYV